MVETGLNKNLKQSVWWYSWNERDSIQPLPQNQVYKVNTRWRGWLKKFQGSNWAAIEPTSATQSKELLGQFISNLAIVLNQWMTWQSEAEHSIIDEGRLFLFKSYRFHHGTIVSTGQNVLIEVTARWKEPLCFDMDE